MGEFNNLSFLKPWVFFAENRSNRATIMTHFDESRDDLSMAIAPT